MAAVVPAAGRGDRAGLGFNKILAPLRGEPVVAHALRALQRCPEVDGVVLVAQAEDAEALQEVTTEGSFSKVCGIVPGGPRRQDSVALGLAALDSGVETVLIHDAARPLVTSDLLTESVRVCRIHGSAVAAVPVSDTIKRAAASRHVLETLEREGLWAVQTPQTFRYDLVKRAYDLGGSGPTVPDDAFLVELLGEPVHLIEGSRFNLKVTVAEDLVVVEALMGLLDGLDPGVGEGPQGVRMIASSAPRPGDRQATTDGRLG